MPKAMFYCHDTITISNVFDYDCNCYHLIYYLFIFLTITQTRKHNQNLKFDNQQNDAKFHCG